MQPTGVPVFHRIKMTVKKSTYSEELEAYFHIHFQGCPPQRNKTGGCVLQAMANRFLSDDLKALVTLRNTDKLQRGKANRQSVKLTAYDLFLSSSPSRNAPSRLGSRRHGGAGCVQPLTTLQRKRVAEKLLRLRSPRHLYQCRRRELGAASSSANEETEQSGDGMRARTSGRGLQGTEILDIHRDSKNTLKSNRTDYLDKKMKGSVWKTTVFSLKASPMSKRPSEESEGCIIRTVMRDA
ncbi:hypothetical protein AOLI_G00156980 [Acnodon oligacanthus]